MHQHVTWDLQNNPLYSNYRVKNWHSKLWTNISLENYSVHSNCCWPMLGTLLSTPTPHKIYRQMPSDYLASLSVELPTFLRHLPTFTWSFVGTAASEGIQRNAEQSVRVIALLGGTSQPNNSWHSVYFYGKIGYSTDEWGLRGWFSVEWLLGCRFLILSFLLNSIFI